MAAIPPASSQPPRPPAVAAVGPLAGSGRRDTPPPFTPAAALPPALPPSTRSDGAPPAALTRLQSSLIDLSALLSAATLAATAAPGAETARHRRLRRIDRGIGLLERILAGEDQSEALSGWLESDTAPSGDDDVEALHAMLDLRVRVELAKARGGTLPR